ncbi:MAG: phosphatase PAP2 family protein, partial [Gaiellaceae bacterium]
MAITAALAVSIARAFPRLRAPLWALVGLMGFTRVLFGAHFPLDTVAGILLGYVSARATYALFTESGLLSVRQRVDDAEGRPAPSPPVGSRLR